MMHNCMIRKGIGILVQVFILVLPVSADEGMWLLPLLDELNLDRMDTMGCKLTAEQIYGPDSTSLKNVIGALDHGSCTAGLISGDGLVLTNHHCGEDEIQSHSSPQQDYLSMGFWAGNREEELPNPGKTISFLVRMEEVTDRVLAMVHREMTEKQREKEIEEASARIEKEITADSSLEAFVLPFFEGNRYYLVVVKTFRDVRLVAAPPQSIGRFGGDTDNWEWPRHNADFCLMRVYTAPDGSPADYSPDNIPYHPANFLPVSLKGYSENDFVMVMGYPGNTERYLTSARVREIADIENADRIRIRKVALGLIDKDMRMDNRVRIQYTAKYSRLSNYYKYSIGQNQCIYRYHVSERRKAQEMAFLHWEEQDSSRLVEYGDITKDMDEAIRERKEMGNALSYLEEMFLLHKAVEIYDFAASALPLYFRGLRYGDDPEGSADLIRDLKQEGKKFFRDFNAPTDRKVASAMFSQYARYVDPVYFPGIYSTIYKKFRGDVDRYLDHLYRKSVFANAARFEKFVNHPLHKKLIRDPAFNGAFALYSTYFQVMDEAEELDDQYEQAFRRYVQGLMEMYPDSIFYPDANSSLRLSYGTICGYRARDAVEYDYYTTLKGVMEKEDTTSRDFTVPPPLKELYREKNYAPYSTDSTMKVCFLTNLDTSGGNSGSPVLNADGEIIGLNFDGNWESMSGDLIFEPEYQRSICVDIRYILFLIDRYGGAGYLLDEMDLHD
jgi:hypothetical protein